MVQGYAQQAKGKCLCIAGAGSNNTKEALSASRQAAEAGDLNRGLVILDLLLPGMSGFGVLQEMRENEFRTLAVTSPMPDCGKTTVAFAKAGLKAVLQPNP